MLGSTEPTDFDLRFSVAGIPVRVSVWFWLIGAIFGYQWLRIGVDFLLAWMIVFFVSILVHELGHALTARYFGYAPRILLYQFGGVAMYEPYRNYTRTKSILITLAGPAAGFLLYGVTRAIAPWAIGSLGEIPERTSMLVTATIDNLLWVNFYWTLLNLLPVLPLDGGKVLQEICTYFSPYRGIWTAFQVSAVVAGMAAAYFFTQQRTYPAFLFVMFCAENLGALRNRRQ